jgi:PadR family transcriptional regulator, regulatory protein PadR
MREIQLRFQVVYLPLLTERSHDMVISVIEGSMSKPSAFVQGTLDVLLLKILALEPLHGWAISQRLTAVSGDVLQVSEGSLYPALHKLEVEGWVRGEWRPSENNRRAKFYVLTTSGRKALKEQSADWDRLAAAVSQVLRFNVAKG